MLIERDPIIDWKSVLFDLVRSGWTLSGIAHSINVPPSTLKGWWYDGAQPLYEHGRALLKLHDSEKRRNSDPADA